MRFRKEKNIAPPPGKDKAERRWFRRKPKSILNKAGMEVGSKSEPIISEWRPGKAPTASRKRPGEGRRTPRQHQARLTSYRGRKVNLARMMREQGKR